MPYPLAFYTERSQVILERNFIANQGLQYRHRTAPDLGWSVWNWSSMMRPSREAKKYLDYYLGRIKG
ncbi:hypothetical protein [Paenibacillus sp. EZ-K15]|uniref:hypothetical protein n=1 Tax=Paenibacillus sp. EZ-K15 TaxID=2044275 RepID=UPI0012904104|nr:hypothetical protein [Paenibacillus sp. EZ-K15]